jgi:uncharacterized protein YwgA
MDQTNDFDSLFNSIGFGFPENSDQLKVFDSVFKNFKYEGDVTKIDPARILSSLELKTETKGKISNVDYHKRTVLAAEIVFRLKDEWSLGHVKLQKLIYLCQNAMNMPIHANFLRQAMGPYDPKLMRSLDKQFEQRKWFKFQTNDFPKYLPLEKAGEHKHWFDIYFGRSSDKVDFIIEQFRGMKTNEVELIATIFACWADLKNAKAKVTNDDISEALYKWSKEKVKFKNAEILNCIEWMISKGIVPGK